MVSGLIEEYGLDRNLITLVGGGGSAAVVVCALAEKMGIRWKIAKNAPYISTIGVALAMLREQLERTVPNPSDEDIKKIRAEAMERIVRAGAREETVDIAVEIDPQRNIVRAVATGATEFREKNPGANALTEEQLARQSAQALGLPEVRLLGAVGRWSVFEGTSSKPVMFGLLRKKTQAAVVVDREGVVRLKKSGVQFLKFRKKAGKTVFAEFLNENTSYSNGSAVLPRVFVFFGEKMIDLTGMQTESQLFSILDVETETLDDNAELMAVAYQ